MGSGSSGKKKVSKKVKKFDLIGQEIRTPDQVTGGWQYRLKICLDNDNCWAEDRTLRVEALRGIVYDRIGFDRPGPIFKITELFFKTGIFVGMYNYSVVHYFIMY